jgi:ribosome recycling factor
MLQAFSVLASCGSNTGVSNDESFRLGKKVQDITNEVIDKLSAVADTRKTEINNS